MTTPAFPWWHATYATEEEEREAHALGLVDMNDAIDLLGPNSPLGELDILDPNIDEYELLMGQEYLQELIEETEDPYVREACIWQYANIGFWFNHAFYERPDVVELIDKTARLRGNPWIRIKDGDPRAWSLFQHHYSYDASKARSNTLFVGPGFKLVLIIPDRKNPDKALALWAWRLEKYRKDEHYGACCAVFRNESAYQASHLIACAEEWAELVWPFIPRYFTHINPHKVRPYHLRQQGARRKIWGRSYLEAGWIPAGRTDGGLITLAKTFIPTAAQWPWEPGAWQDINPHYWPERARTSERNPKSGGVPEYQRTERKHQHTQRRQHATHALLA